MRAETREDRGMWMEALQAVKDMFPRMSNSELMAQMGNSVAVSTDKLRQRLLEEGVTEAAIQDSMQIMKSEFSALRNHLLLLKQKQLLLLDTMRQLEVCTTAHNLLCFILHHHFFVPTILRTKTVRSNPITPKRKKGLS